MTIRSQHTSNTLEDILTHIRNRVQSGNPPPSNTYLELCHMAELYKHHLAEPRPAEPGAQSTNHDATKQFILQEIDDMRMIATKLPDLQKHEIMTRLENLAARVR